MLFHFAGLFDAFSDLIYKWFWLNLKQEDISFFYFQNVISSFNILFMALSRLLYYILNEFIQEKYATLLNILLAMYYFES